MRKVYMDNSSTSFPKAPGLGEAMGEFINRSGCNVGRGGYEMAYEVGVKVLETRELISDLFGLKNAENVVFTSNVTAGINYVVQGLLHDGDHVIISAMEHNAVARAVEGIKAKGVTVSVAKCTADGRLDLEDFESQFRPNTKLVLMLHASNVSGTIIDAEAVGAICRSKGVFFVLDAAQSAGVIPIDFSKMNLSALCITGHKGLLGPQGIGALLMTDEFADEMDPVVFGGTGSRSDELTMPDFLPDKFEAGTLNLPGIIGLKASIEYIESQGIDKIHAHEAGLTERFISGVRELPGVRIPGPADISQRLGVVSLDFEDIDNAEVAYLLDAEFGIMTRCGLQCAPLAHKTLGTFPQGTVRFSFGYFNTEEEVDYAVDAVRQILKK